MLHRRPEMKLPLATLLSCTALTVAAGCAARSYAPLEENVESLQSIREALERANVQTDRTMASLNKVVAWADRDPRPAMDEFEAELAELEELATEADDRAKAMRVASEQYLQTWNAENAEIKTAGLQELSDDRRSTARTSWRNVQDEADHLSAAFEQLLGRLRELKGYLANNLSPAGIDGARPFIETAEGSARELKERIADLTSELDGMTAKVAPAGSEG
jgi:chromosome segregation ATPase